MDLLNGTKMVAGYTLGVEPSAREHLVVVVKGTFDFPANGGEPTLAEEQATFVYADTFTGKPGFSAPLDECDFAFRKPRCDVLVNGAAYAPDGKPTTRVTVGLKVGPMRKVFDVVGDRAWSALPLRIAPEPPRPFVRMPITYDRAFGGLDEFSADKSRHSAYMQNPVGRGYHRQLDIAFVDGTPAPNTEERDNPVGKPDGAYRPMALGPVGRGWQPRLGFAGTYDQGWLDNVFPFLPADFREDYYQAAPADQQIAYPKGEVLRSWTSRPARVTSRPPMVLSASVLPLLAASSACRPAGTRLNPPRSKWSLPAAKSVMTSLAAPAVVTSRPRTKTSLPPPPVIRSAPVPPTSLSARALPSSVSFPMPPSSRLVTGIFCGSASREIRKVSSPSFPNTALLRWPPS